MPRHRHTPKIRVFTIPAPRFDYFKACQMVHQRATDTRDPGRLVTNSDSLEMLLNEHHHFSSLANRVNKLMSDHIRAQEAGAPHDFPVESLKGFLLALYEDIARDHDAVICAEGGARKVPE